MNGHGAFSALGALAPGAVWKLHWRLLFRRRRLLVWNLLVPAVLLVPMTLSVAASAHRALVFTVFVVFFGAYGSCIPLIRDGASGWAEKVSLTGYGMRRWWVERLLVSSVIDLVELLPVTALLLLLAGAGAAEAIPVFPALAMTLLFANLLGAVVAALVRSLAEAALGCAVVSLFALHLAGTFRPAVPGSWSEAAASGSPLRPLYLSWHGALSPVTEAASGAGSWLPPLITLSLSLGGFVLLGSLLGRRIGDIR